MKVSFRFFAVNEDQALTIARFFKPNVVTVSRPNGIGMRDVTLALEDNSVCDRIIHCVSNFEFPASRYGLYASIVTERDHDGFRLPPFTVELVRRLGGHVDFAFIHA